MSLSGPSATLTRQLGLLGFPVSHSLSPAMHNKAFRAQRMNCCYSAYAVEPARLKEAVAGLAALGFLGLNVTIPHKEAIMEFLDEIAPTASLLGAVNTIVNRAGRLIGYNTDGWGFIRSLEEAGVRVSGQRAVVLGAGGAARAVAVHLAMAGVSSLTISNRSPQRAAELTRTVQAALAAPERERQSHTPELHAVEALSPEERSALVQSTLVINCTSLGMDGQPTGQTPLPEIHLLPPTAVVYDTVYRPAQTRLLQEAASRGLSTVGGLGMLVHQGACSWEYWFGRRGPVSVMRSAAREAMEGDE